MNKTYIIANWKMNPSNAQEAQQLFEAVAEGTAGYEDVEAVLCPPFIYIPQILHTNKYQIPVGAQDCFWEKKGAFTGEVSPQMLKDLGCTYVIVGHSERKNYLGETFEMVNKKIKAALAVELTPVVCIGEKQQGENKQELQTQMEEILGGIPGEQARKLILAYEPEWAISSNKNAQAAEPEDCKKSIGYMRSVIEKLFGFQEIPILYGGSTNSKNIRGFLGAGTQGALVGSASLDAKEFAQLVGNAVS